MNIEKIDKERLSFRRQFIIGRRPFNKFSTWGKTSIGDGWVITAHPELPVTRASSSEFDMVVLGYLLDPRDTALNNEEIVEKVRRQVSSFDGLLKVMDGLGGRYVVVSCIEGMVRIFSDCAGFRQIFFLMEDGHVVWCASQPALIAEVFAIKEDSSVMTDLGRLPLFRDTTEYWFPGNRTLIQNVLHLRPNHCLELTTGQVKRFWPSDRLQPHSLIECVERVAPLLQGLIESAVQRFDVAFTITAGLDTRVLLAACRSAADKIYFFTHTHARLNEEGADIAVPRAMLERFGVEHHVVANDRPMDEAFASIFNENVTAARARIGLNAYAIFSHFQRLDKNPLVVNGVCGEITRCFYRLPRWFRLNGKALATLAHMIGSRIAEEEFDDWLKGAGEISDMGMNILDAFYWENRNANWSAMSYSEYDIAFESLSPFNCRELIATMLGTERSDRLPPRYSLHEALIRQMWPELLEFPINPPTGMTDRLLHTVRGMKPYEFLRFLKFLYRLRSWR